MKSTNGMKKVLKQLNNAADNLSIESQDGASHAEEERYVIRGARSVVLQLIAMLQTYSLEDSTPYRLTPVAKKLDADTGVNKGDMSITACIRSPGDRSVGIADGTIDIDLGDYVSYDAFFAPYDGGREEYRKGLMDWANTFHENCGPCQILFGDECPDCGGVLFDASKPKCSNAKCISNQPEGAD